MNILKTMSKKYENEKMDIPRLHSKIGKYCNIRKTLFVMEQLRSRLIKENQRYPTVKELENALFISDSMFQLMLSCYFDIIETEKKRCLAIAYALIHNEMVKYYNQREKETEMTLLECLSREKTGTDIDNLICNFFREHIEEIPFICP